MGPDYVEETRKEVRGRGGKEARARTGSQIQKDVEKRHLAPGSGVD